MESSQAVYTVAELAELLRCGRNQAYAFVASGAVRAIRVGAAIRIPASEIDRMLGLTTESSDRRPNPEPDHARP
jgi:excisionase family DNA binding protein